MKPRLLCAAGGALLALPYQAVQLALLVGRNQPVPSWQEIGLANFVLLIGICALAADFPLAGRAGRAVLVGVGIPMLLPGPSVVDSVVRAVNPSDYMLWIPFLVLNLLLLLMLGCAEAGIYLLATRPELQP